MQYKNRSTAYVAVYTLHTLTILFITAMSSIFTKFVERKCFGGATGEVTR